MTRKRKIILGIIVIAVIGTALFLILHFTLTPNDGNYRIIRLGSENIGNYTPSDFSSSLLQLHSNGAFNIEIILSTGTQKTSLFIGNGRFERRRSEITFYFANAWLRLEAYPNLVEEGSHSTTARYTGYTHTFIISSGRIIFYDHNGQRYYFR